MNDTATGHWLRVHIFTIIDIYSYLQCLISWCLSSLPRYKILGIEIEYMNNVVIFSDVIDLDVGGGGSPPQIRATGHCSDTVNNKYCFKT